MRASLTLDKSGLDQMIAQLDDPSIKGELDKIMEKKALAALVGQAIADNFNQQGPGWAPLKASSIRKSVAKNLQARLKKMTNAQLVAHEKKAQNQKTGQNRMILRKTGMLMASATVPGARGNVFKKEGSTLIWGTDLIYAGVHNKGYPPRNIPKREFMVIRKEWMDQITNYVAEQAFQIIVKKMLRGTG